MLISLSQAIYIKGGHIMKLNKLIVFVLCALLVTINIVTFNFQSKRYNLLEKDYYKLKTAYDENQKDSKPDELQKLKQKVSNLQDELNSSKEITTSLRKKLKQKKNEKEPLSTATTPVATTSSSTTNYLKIKYWFDDKNYQLSDEEQKIYKDPYLSKKVSSKRIFVSSTISEERLENGQTVYSAMTSKGLVYSSSYIDLSQLEYTDYSVSSKSISSKENEKYKKIRFYKTEEKRRLGEESEQKWYSDYTLSNEVKDSKYLRIVSEVDDFVASNGVQVYCALTQNGDIVYMHESPNLETINEE